MKSSAMKVNKSLFELVYLKGKRVLITGSAAGIGRAMAYRFAEAGAALELVDINRKGLGTVKKECAKFKSEINLHKVDISQKEEIDALWQELSGKEPDVLVNNAGVYPFKQFLEVESSIEQALGDDESLGAGKVVGDRQQPADEIKRLGKQGCGGQR